MVIKTARLSQWRAYRKPLSLFPVIRSMTPYDLPFHENGVSDAPSWYVEFGMAISPQRASRSTSCIILWWDFWGRRIEWRYYRLDQIQNGSRPPSWKISAASRGFSVFISYTCRVYMHSKCRSRSQIHLLLMMKNSRTSLKRGICFSVSGCSC